MVDVFAAQSCFQPPSIPSFVEIVSSVSPEAIV